MYWIAPVLPSHHVAFTFSTTLFQTFPSHRPNWSKRGSGWLQLSSMPFRKKNRDKGTGSKVSFKMKACPLAVLRSGTIMPWVRTFLGVGCMHAQSQVNPSSRGLGGTQSVTVTASLPARPPPIWKQRLCGTKILKSFHVWGIRYGVSRYNSS